MVILERTLNTIKTNRIKINTNIKIISPQGYSDFQTLIANCKGVLTDSGGIQKEAYLWKKPCFTIRSETEWIETVELGWNTIVKPNEGNLKKTIASWKKPEKYNNIYGNGNSAHTIIQKLSGKKSA